MILDGEGPLEEEMATHSSVLAWRIPWTEEPGGQESDMTTAQVLFCLKKGKKKPVDLTIKRSCAHTLSSPMDFCPPGRPALPAGQVTVCVDPGAIAGAFL